MTSRLSDAQIRQFHDEGWTSLGKIIDDDTIEQLRAEEFRFRKFPLYDDSDSPGAKTIFRSQMSAYSQAIREVGTQGTHIDLVTQLMGPDVLWYYTQFVTKFPDGDSGKSAFPWHQDFGYGHISPAIGLSVWVALDDVNEENGCVWISPESHKRGLVEHKSTSHDHWYMDADVEGDGIPAVLRAGEAVAFHGLTLHRSLLNHTNAPRRGFFMEYVHPDCRDRDGVLVADLPRAYVVSGEARVELRPELSDAIRKNQVHAPPHLPT